MSGFAGIRSFGPNKAACLGDSITAFTGGYCDQLIAQHTYAIHKNLGNGGHTIANILGVYNSSVRGKRYARISVMAGTVNVRGIVDPVPVEDAIEDLGTLYARAKADGTSVVALTVPPQGNADSWTEDRQVYLETLNNFIASTVAANPGTMRLWDTYELLRNGVDLAAEYDSGDGYHLNLAGHNAILTAFGDTF